MAFYGMLCPRDAFPLAKANAKKALAIDPEGPRKNSIMFVFPQNGRQRRPGTFHELHRSTYFCTAPELGEAHASLAFISTLHDWDWVAAEEGFMRAIELNPGHATAQHWYAELLMAMGRPQQAPDAAKRAIDADPLSLIINTLLGMVHYMVRDYERAIEACQRTLELEPAYVPVYIWLGLSYVRSEQYDEAIQVFERARSTSTMKVPPSSRCWPMPTPPQVVKKMREPSLPSWSDCRRAATSRRST